MAEKPHDIRGGVEPRPIPTVSVTLPDDQLLEMLYAPGESRTSFALWDGERWRDEPAVTLSPGHRLVPYSASNNLVKNEVVLFPSKAEEYSSEAQLLEEVRAFIHRYVDVSPLFERIASYYVLLSWIYDGFNELPYLRLRGDPGSGKTRFLLTVGSLCYKPMFASGASTVSPIFRILDTFRGTLVVDEADFRLSDERAEIVKILNNGNARGFPVLRSEAVGQREFNPRAYAVFGPKLVATRRVFEDRALESRCLTEEMGQSRLRNDVPINLPPCHKEEALHIRNQLLMFRFRNFGKRLPSEALVDRLIEPRLNQIFIPLMTIVEDPKARAELQEFARRYNGEMIDDRAMDMEAQVLEVIRGLLASGPDHRLSVKEITGRFSDLHGEEYDRRVTSKWIGSVIRRRLYLKTEKSHGVFVLSTGETAKLSRLYEKYGVAPREDETIAQSIVTGRVEVGEVGGVLSREERE
jgi:hypothetical protein